MCEWNYLIGTNQLNKNVLTCADNSPVVHLLFTIHDEPSRLKGVVGDIVGDTALRVDVR